MQDQQLLFCRYGWSERDEGSGGESKGDGKAEVTMLHSSGPKFVQPKVEWKEKGINQLYTS